MADRELWIASGNADKLRELTRFARESFPEWERVIPREPKGVAEDAPTFAGNAKLKAEALARELLGEGARDFAVLADDSGICVDALGGAPGLRSGRYAGAPADPAANLRKLLRELAGTPAAGRNARYRCALHWLEAIDGRVVDSRGGEGVREGSVAAAPRGANGYAYDSVFVDPASGMTYGEMDPEEKHRDSHRARAFAALRTTRGSDRP